MVIVSGAFFDVRDFHKVVLDGGRVPLDILESHVHRWIQEARPSTPQPTPQSTSHPMTQIHGSSLITSHNSCYVIAMSWTICAIITIAVNTAFTEIQI